MGDGPSLAELIDESRRLAQEGELGAALQRARRVLEQARAAGDSESVIAALLIMGDAQYRLGHYGQTRSLAEEALARAATDAPARADALRQLGACAMETESASKAEELFLCAADVAREIGYVQTRMRALHDLAAGIYTPRGQFDLALAAADEACSIASQHNLPEVSFPLITGTFICILTGQYPRARVWLAKLDAVVTTGSLPDGYRCWLAALCAQDEGKLENAAALYAQARSIAEKIGDPALNVFLRLGLSGYHRILGNASSAYEWANDAVAIATRASNRRMWGRALIERARSCWLCDRPADAEADLRAAIADLAARHAAFDLARAQFFLAALLRAQQSREAPSAWRDAARSIIAGNYAFLLDQERALAFPLIAGSLNHADREIAALSAKLMANLERVPPPPLRILTLGRFEVRQKNLLIPDSAWRQRRAGELFRLLLVSPNRSLARDEIVESLWRDRPRGSTQSLFHQATSALRRALEPDLPDKFPSRYLQIEEARVSLNVPPGSSLDFEQFQQRVQGKDWDAALSLYAGALFPGDQYADWAVVPRERLSRLYLGTLYAAAQQRLKVGECQEALDACHRILELDPWQENAVLIGMQAFIALNDRAGALRLYRELERTLRDELGIAPQALLRELYESLL